MAVMCRCLSFFSSLRPDVSLLAYRNRCFQVALYCLLVHFTKFISVNQEGSPSIGKNASVASEPCHAQKYVPSVIFSGSDIPDSPWV